MLEQFLDDPQASANHMVLGMDLDQRREANLKKGKKVLHTWN